MDGSMIRRTFLAAGALAGACAVAACGGASAAEHPPSTASPGAVDGGCAWYAYGQPAACHPERRDPGPRYPGLGLASRARGPRTGPW
jgi:hypothetical protein